MRRTAKVALLAGLAGAMALWYASEHKFGSSGSASSNGGNAGAPAIPVVGGQVELRDVPVLLSGIGSVQSLNTVMVKARVDGQLQTVDFTEGQDIRAGTVLAQIDPRPYNALLQQAQANKAKDEAQLANARVDFQRFTNLAGAGAAPKQNVDTLKAQVAGLEATVQADQAAIETARLQLEFTTIRAPLDGRPGLRLVDPGSIVHASDPSGLVTITQMQPIGALFSLPQDSLPELLSEMPAQEIEVAAWARDGTSEVARGKLVFVDSQIDTATGQVRLKAVFDNKERTLWPGELISVRIRIRTIKDATVVPTKAVSRGQSGPYVFRIKQDDTVEQVAVTLGATADGVVVIKSELSSGDRIVVDGQSRIQSGAKVDAKSAPTKESSRAAPGVVE